MFVYTPTGGDWQAPVAGTALVTAAAAGTTPLICDGAAHTFLTSPSLAAGVWLVTGIASLENAGAGSIFVDMGLAPGTAAVTFVGNPAAAIGFPGASFQFATLPLVCQAVAVVTVAGTVLFRYNATNGASAVFQGTGVNNNLGVSSSLTAVRLA